MVGGNYFDGDGLFRQYGTSKAVATTAGDYMSYGETRQIECTIDLTTLTPFGTNIIQANTTFIPSGVFVESVEVDVEVAGTSGGSATLNVGLIGNDRSTVASATGFVNAAAVATLTQGARLLLVGGSTGAGGYIGTVAGTPSTGYLIANAGTAVFTAGKVKVRINYRTTTNITQ